MARLRAAVFGFGHMGRLHAEKLRARGDVEVVVVDPALGFDPPRPLRVDLAVVATPAERHAEVALPLLERGVPCLVEKPLAATLDEARALARFERLAVGFVERFNPALDPVRGVRPRFLEALRLGPHPGRGDGIDVVRELMVHDLDLVHVFLPGAVRGVRAVGAGVRGGLPDIAHAHVELEAGVAVLAASRVSREPVRRLRLVDEGTYWSIDLLHRRVHRVPWGEGRLDPEPVPVPRADPLEREHAAFLDAVAGRAPFAPSGAEALRTMELAADILAEIERSPARPRAAPPSEVP